MLGKNIDDSRMSQCRPEPDSYPSPVFCSFFLFLCILIPPHPYTYNKTVIGFVWFWISWSVTGVAYAALIATSSSRMGFDCFRDYKDVFLLFVFFVRVVMNESHRYLGGSEWLRTPLNKNKIREAQRIRRANVREQQ